MKKITEYTVKNLIDEPESLAQYAGDVMLLVGLIVLFIELLKSTTSRRTAIVNHALSMLLFVACLVEFLLAPAFATSTFFLLTVMVLLDVLAGFIVTIVSARRDVDVGSDGA